MKKIFILIFGILLFVVVVFLALAGNKPEEKVELKTELRDEKSMPLPRAENIIEMDRSKIDVVGDGLPSSSKVWQGSKISPLTSESVAKLMATFEIKGEPKKIEGTELFLVEEDNKVENKRMFLSENTPSVSYSVFLKNKDKKKELDLSEIDDMATKLINSLPSGEAWKSKIEQKIYLKDGGETAVVSTQEDFDTVRYLASWQWEGNSVYSSKKGYPIRLDFSAKDGLAYAQVEFLPNSATLQKDNLAIKNMLQLADSSQYKILQVDGDQNFYTFDLEHRFKNMLVKQGNFRVGYVFTEDKLLWPYVFIDGEIYDESSQGKARVLLGTSLIL